MKLKLLVIGLLVMRPAFSQDNQAQVLAKIRASYEPAIPRIFALEYTRVRTSAYQSYDYRTPDSLRSTHNISIDLDKSLFYAHREAFFPGDFHFTSREWQQDTVSHLFDSNGVFLGKEVITQPANRYDQVKSEVRELSDWLLVEELLSSDSDSIELAETSDDGSSALSAWIADIGRQVYTFNDETGLLVSVERLGTGERWLFRKNHSLPTVSEIQYYRRGAWWATYYPGPIEILETIDPDLFVIPEGYVLQPPAQSAKITPLSERLFLVSPIAGDRNVLFLVQGQSITVFGAPIADRFSKQVVDLIKEKFPDKSISEVYVTHYHSDHIGGLGHYARSGATILIDKFGIEAVKNYPRFKDLASEFQFQEIKADMIKDGVQYFIPGDRHCIGQSFAYFPSEQVIYQGDFLEIPRDNTIPHHHSESALIFVNFLKKRNIAYKRIVGHHRNSNIVEATVRRFSKSVN